MALAGLVFLVVALILIGVGVAIGLVACVLTACLLGLGVISSSLLAGLLTRRPLTAVRWFLIQCGLLSGLPAGAVCAWLIASLCTGFEAGWPIVLYGALGGALAGLLLALACDAILRRVLSLLRDRPDPAA